MPHTAFKLKIINGAVFDVISIDLNMPIAVQLRKCHIPGEGRGKLIFIDSRNLVFELAAIHRIVQGVSEVFAENLTWDVSAEPPADDDPHDLNARLILG